MDGVRRVQHDSTQRNEHATISLIKYQASSQSCQLVVQNGESSTGAHANGFFAQDVGAIAGLSMAKQAFAAVSDTNSTAVMQGTNSIFGLVFSNARYVLC